MFRPLELEYLALTCGRNMGLSFSKKKFFESIHLEMGMLLRFREPKCSLLFARWLSFLNQCIDISVLLCTILAVGTGAVFFMYS